MPTENKITAPEEYAGVDFGIDGRSVRVSQEAYSIFLAREAAGREKIAVLQQCLTAADERADTAISLLECVLDTGELTREKHLDLEADICRLVTDFWGDRKSARIPSPPRCPDCGYTEQDCREQMDHHLCGSPEPAPARNP
ncbi:hypothetical protein [Pseudomonas gregormendelii]